jgi:metal-responsive CopG/Arc/MetJ family transcriptional regulator
MTETNYQRVEFQIPHEWKKKLDEKGLKFGCTTTSEIIRYLIRDFIS